MEDHMYHLFDRLSDTMRLVLLGALLLIGWFIG